MLQAVTVALAAVCAFAFHSVSHMAVPDRNLLVAINPLKLGICSMIKTFPLNHFEPLQWNLKKQNDKKDLGLCCRLVDLVGSCATKARSGVSEVVNGRSIHSFCTWAMGYQV